VCCFIDGTFQYMSQPGPSGNAYVFPFIWFSFNRLTLTHHALENGWCCRALCKSSASILHSI
jgi:hypothetical protein